PAVGGPAVVVDLDRDGRRAVGVGGRGVGQGTGRGDGRLSREQAAVVVRDDEVHGLATLVGRAGGDAGRPVRHGLGTGVLVHGLVDALGEARDVVDGVDGDRQRRDRGGVHPAVGGI